jgi:HNH endonuclease
MLTSFVQSRMRIAQAEVETLWDAYNVDYCGYPPDWRWRKESVNTRDGHTCTKCGWPNGVARRKRNLRVHHRVPLARGGNNDLVNLTTLSTCVIALGKVRDTGGSSTKGPDADCHRPTLIRGDEQRSHPARERYQSLARNRNGHNTYRMFSKDRTGFGRYRAYRLLLFKEG